VRALVENTRSGRVVQGGSTITQQLAKNLFLSNSRTFRRKFQEIALALWLESRFTKDQLLALYVSRVYFGAGAWGIEAASERYFDRPARELTLLQSALLAGLVKAPSRLNPAQQEAGARARAEIVLNVMVASNFISESERDAALKEDLRISRTSPAGNLGYFRDWIEPLLTEVIGQARDDFVVETTLDIQAQRAGEAAVAGVLAERGEAMRVSEAALLALDANGGVRAMVGGRAYGKEEGQSEFNRVTQARRQPGSSFKYFIYLAAMEAGLTPWSVRVDAPVTIGDWSPGNYNDHFFGPIELVGAFARSLNMVAIVVANEIGGDSIIETARRLGVRSPLHNYRSIALGAQEITLLEMTQAYAAMAADGYRVEAHGVSRVRSANREVVWTWRPRNRVKVIEDRPRRHMNYMMNRVVESGTGTSARIPGRELAAKTGTTNDYRDAWFVGFTPGLAAGVWVGNDDHRVAMARVTGGQLPAEIWRRFMEVAIRAVPARPLDMPTPEDYGTGPPAPVAVSSGAPTIRGAPIGPSVAANPPPDPNVDRSLDFGPEG
jgi:penicillin-binding protein 1A